MNQFASPISIIFMIYALEKYIGNVGVNTFALISYVIGITSSFTSGTAEGLQPLFGRAYGAQNREDLKYYLTGGILIGLVGTLATVILIVIFCPAIYSLFTAEPETIKMAVHGTHILEWGYLPVVFSTAIASYLYSTTRTGSAVIINLLRAFLINIPVIVFLPMIFGDEAIWYCMSVYESVVFVITLIIKKYNDQIICY